MGNKQTNNKQNFLNVFILNSVNMKNFFFWFMWIVQHSQQDYACDYSLFLQEKILQIFFSHLYG